MLVATQQDLYIQKYAHHWIYNLVLRKVRECSLVDGTWIMCSMTAVLEYLPLPSVHRLDLFKFIHGERQIISVATDLRTWHRYHSMLVDLLRLHDITHHFVKLACSSRAYGSDK
jgi:hypothetical protein